MTVFRPHDLQDALDYLAEAPAMLIAGGTDVFPALGAMAAPDRALDLSALDALRHVTRDGGGWRIGGGVTWAELCATDLPPAFDALKAAGRQIGSVQIQNTATLVGNVCNASPAADGVPVLMALDASVELCSLSGKRVVPIQSFVTGIRRTDLRPAEIVTAIHVPELSGDVRSGFEKLGSRAYLVISIASVAAVVGFEKGRVATARIVVGACSPVPMRLDALEADLIGEAADKLPRAVASVHLAELCPIDDIRATAAYRLEAVEELLRRVLATCGAGQ
ncbi:MAG: FAD binding domain-containing protein [Albidovulum sp.]